MKCSGLRLPRMTECRFEVAHMTQSYMAQLGARIADNGYSIIPTMPGSKVPGNYNGMAKRWEPYRDWSRHCTRETRATEIGIWESWPNAGVGIACGSVVGVDIDIVQDRDIADRVETLARDMLGDTPAMRVGLWPKRLLVYRAETPFSGFKRHPIEVLARGQQFVAHAIHPETGEPYYWPGESLADLDIAQLPAVTEERCCAFVAAAIEIIPPALLPASLSTDSSTSHHSAALQAGTIEAVEDALKYIPNPDLHYDDWIRVGLAIKGAVGDAGWPLFERWSAQSSKDVAKTTERAWRSFRPTSIGAGTIYYLAEQHGWLCPAHVQMNSLATWDSGHHPAQALIDKLSSKAPTQPDNIFVPDAFRMPGGVIGDFVDYIIGSAVRPQPILAVAAALAAVGVAAGRRYASPTDLRTNLYVVGMAESGGGKDHARRCIVEAFAQAGIGHLIGGNKIASGAGLLTALTRQPASLFQIDEFGQFLATAVDKKKAPKHVAEIWDNLTELATSASSTFFGAEYADQKERPRQDIAQPCCVIHATTVPGPFWRALQSGSLADGSLARWLVFQTDNPIPDAVQQPAKIRDIPERLLVGLRAVAAGADGHCDYAMLYGAKGSPTPYTVPYSGAAAKRLGDLLDEITARQRAHIGTSRSATLARIWEHVVKVALIKAVSDNSALPEIDLPTVQWAEQVVTFCVESMMDDADRYVADNEIEATNKRVLDLIRRAGPEGLRHADLMRRATFVRARELREVIQALAEGGSIVVRQEQTATKPAVTYCATEIV